MSSLLTATTLHLLAHFLCTQQPGTAGAREQTDPAQMVQFLLTAARAHHDLFPHLDVRLRFTTGRAATTDKALRGDWDSKPEPVVCQVRWAFDGDRVRRDDVYDPELLKKHEWREGNSLVRDIATTYALWNSSVEIVMYDGQPFQVSHKGELGRQGWTPFNVGMSDPTYRRAEVIRTRLHGNVTYLGEREFDGARLPVLRFEQKYGQALLSRQIDEYWIDPARGYTPVRVETRYDDMEKAEQILVVYEFMELSNGRWLPSLARYANARGGGPVACYEARIEDVQADRPPPPETFEFSLPPSYGGFHRVAQARLIARKGHVGLTDFRSDGTLLAGDREIELVPVAGPVPTGAGTGGDSNSARWPFGRKDWTYGPTVWCLLGALGLLVAVFAIRRVRR